MQAKQNKTKQKPKYHGGILALGSMGICTVDQTQDRLMPPKASSRESSLRRTPSSIKDDDPNKQVISTQKYEKKGGEHHKQINEQGNAGSESD